MGGNRSESRSEVAQWKRVSAFSLTLCFTLLLPFFRDYVFAIAFAYIRLYFPERLFTLQPSGINSDSSHRPLWFVSVLNFEI